MSKLQKESLIVIILSFGILLLSVLIFMQENNKKKECNRVLAYIPIKGKWLEREICLEGLR
jgi:type II secretory pathway component PulF